MKRVWASILLLIGTVVTAASLPYVCDWHWFTETSTCPASCTTQTPCYTYTWEKPECDLAVAGDCYLPAGNVVATKKTYQCTQTGAGCICDWENQSSSGQQQIILWRQICTMTDPNEPPGG